MFTVLRINNKEVCHNQCGVGYVYCPAMNSTIQMGGIDSVAVDRDTLRNSMIIDIQKRTLNTRTLEDEKKSMRTICATCKFAKTRY